MIGPGESRHRAATSRRRTNELTIEQDVYETYKKQMSATPDQVSTEENFPSRGKDGMQKCLLNAKDIRRH